MKKIDTGMSVAETKTWACKGKERIKGIEILSGTLAKVELEKKKLLLELNGSSINCEEVTTFSVRPLCKNNEGAWLVEMSVMPMGPQVMGLAYPKGKNKILPEENFVAEFDQNTGQINFNVEDEIYGHIIIKDKMLMVNEYDKYYAKNKNSCLREPTDIFKKMSECGRLGYVNDDDDWVIEPLFEEAGNFYNGLANVAYRGKWGTINLDKEWIISPDYRQINCLNGRFYLAETDELTNVFDVIEGNQVLTMPKCQGVKVFGSPENHFLVVERTGENRNTREIYNSKGEIAFVNPQINGFDEIGQFFQKLSISWARKDNKYYLIDDEGNILTDAYDWIADLEEDGSSVALQPGLFTVAVKGKKLFKIKVNF